MELKLLAFIRSIGYGALIGAGILGCLYCFYPWKFSDGTGLNDAMTVGALLGGGLGKLIERLTNWMISPITRYTSYYWKTYLINKMTDDGRLSPDSSIEMIEEVSKKYFLE